MTLCLRVLNHSHICVMEKHMKNLCTSYFHAILLFRLVEAIQNCQMLILHGDFGLNGTQYLDDVSQHWHYDTYKKPKYTLVQFAFGNKKNFTHTHTLISKKNKMTKLLCCLIQPIQGIPSFLTVWITQKYTLRTQESLTWNIKLFFQFHNRWGTFYISSKYFWKKKP